MMITFCYQRAEHFSIIERFAPPISTLHDRVSKYSGLPSHPKFLLQFSSPLPLADRIFLRKQLEWDPKKIKQEKKEQEMKARQAAAAAAGAGSTTAGSEQVMSPLLSFLLFSPISFRSFGFYWFFRVP